MGVLTILYLLVGAVYARGRYTYYRTQFDLGENDLALSDLAPSAILEAAVWPALLAGWAVVASVEVVAELGTRVVGVIDSVAVAAVQKEKLRVLEAGEIQPPVQPEGTLAIADQAEGAVALAPKTTLRP